MADNLKKGPSEKKFFCSFSGCNKSFTRMYRAQRHLRTHSNEKPFICTIDGCEKAFTCKTYLNKHLKRPHNLDNDLQKMDKVDKTEISYKCPYCEKTFKHKFNLKLHLPQHNKNLNQFKCNSCDMSFALKSRLIRHQKMHVGYKCNHDNCEFVAEKWSTLQKHISIEHRPTYKCEKCDLLFNKPSGLTAHLLTHEDVKHFKCNVDNCGKDYLNKSNLKAHIKVAHQKYTIKCPLCPNEYRYKMTLKRHMKVHEKSPSDKNMQMNNEKKIFIKRTSMAVKLSGHQISEIELKKLLIEDKEFRLLNGKQI